MCIRAVGIITFIGVFLFVMLFEGRARYLFNSTAVFGGIAAMGYYKLADGKKEKISLEKIYRKSINS